MRDEMKMSYLARKMLSLSSHLVLALLRVARDDHHAAVHSGVGDEVLGFLEFELQGALQACACTVFCR